MGNAYATVSNYKVKFEFFMSEGFEDTDNDTSPVSVNLTALSRRLARIWRSLIGSPMIIFGDFLSII